MRYQHILWDFDGTLFDSYPVMAQAFLETLAEDGISETYEKVMFLMQISATHLVHYCQSTYSLRDDFLDRYRKRKKESEILHLQPFPHAESVCRAICDSGGRNCIYTHRGRSAIEFLAKFNMLDYFADFITKEDGFKRKPDPEAILQLLDRQGIRKDTALMVGDRVIDMLAAKNAGIDACFFAGMGQGACEVANYRISDLEEMLGVLGLRRSEGNKD